MNDTQWVFELESMNLEDEEKLKQMSELTEIIRESVANMLGLNLLPVEDVETGLLRKPVQDEYVPLALALGRADYVKMVMEKREEFAMQEQERFKLMDEGLLSPGAPSKADDIVERTPEELEEFMKDEGDIDFENTPEEMQKLMDWGSKETQAYLENIVLNKDDIDETATDLQPARTIGRARRDLIDEVRKEKSEGNSTSIPIRIESDSIMGGIPEKPERSRIVVDIEDD